MNRPMPRSDRPRVRNGRKNAARLLTHRHAARLITGGRLIAKRILILAAMICTSWCIMTLTHEVGHILGGWCCGATLTDYDLLPWHLPYSFFNPDPHPLVTLWAGPILGVFVPLLIAVAIRRDWSWFVAYFCVLANGTYIAVGWFSNDAQLDTTKLLQNGAHPISLLLYCITTIVAGYVGFRRVCVRMLGVSDLSQERSLKSHSGTDVRS